jgi:hypothetical protein
LRNKLVLAALLLVDAVVLAVLVLSDGALRWLSTLPFLGEVMDRLGPFFTAGALAQVIIIVIGYTIHLFLNTWQQLSDSHGGTKPNLGIAFIFTVALLFCISLYLRHEKPASEQSAKLASTVAKDPPQAAGGNRNNTTPARPPTKRSSAAVSGSQQQHLPALFRLQRPIRGPARSPQQFVVDFDVTEIELKTPVAYASFKIFALVLDDQELQAYQIRNGELSITVDRQTLPQGAHTLAVREKQKGSTRTDVQTFEFMIVDALR